MICAFATGCNWSILRSKASAGGQLEQPSEVNNSASTGTRALGSAARSPPDANMKIDATRKCFIYTSFASRTPKVTIHSSSYAYVAGLFHAHGRLGRCCRTRNPVGQVWRAAHLRDGSRV